MTQLQTSQTTERDAIAYRDHVRALGPVRLSDLAFHMDRTGGPVDAMDATVESLDPLWEWYLSRMADQFPEIPEGSAPSYTKFLQWKLADQTGRAAYAVEPVAHYLLVLLKRYLPDARWDLHPPLVPDDDGRHLTVVRARQDYERPLEQIPYGLALTVLKEMNGRSAPDYLRTKVTGLLGLDSLGDPAPPTGSVLAPFLLTPAVPPSDPRRFMSGAGTSRLFEEPPGRVSVALERHYIAAPNANLNDELFDVPALDAARLAQSLGSLGARVEGRPVVETDLLDDSAMIIIGDWQLQLAPQTAEGHLRSLRVELLQGSADEWDRFVADLDYAALSAGARFAPAHEFER